MKQIFLLITALGFLLISCKKIITNTPEPNKPVPEEDTTGLINYKKNITIVNWNIEWFGSSMFGGNLNVQEANAGKILKYMNADLYGICEVVDTARFGRMVRDNLGDEYRYKISFYPTFLDAQRLAFVYNRNIFRNVTIRPFMGISTNAYYYFAQRYPLQFKAEVVVNGSRNVVSYFLIHAKAGADEASYSRRLNGSAELKDSLDRYFIGKNFIVFGDYNDHLTGSIIAGKTSPYNNIVVDGDYNPITLPLEGLGNQSTINYQNSVIDHQIISSVMTKWYMNNSAKIRTDVTQVVPDFNTGNTSDHYPVSSVYNMHN
ncbi:MAG: endonuclease/exonuclease/phosphatase [Niabella sp.]